MFIACVVASFYEWFSPPWRIDGLFSWWDVTAVTGIFLLQEDALVSGVLMLDIGIWVRIP